MPSDSNPYSSKRSSEVDAKRAGDDRRRGTSYTISMVFIPIAVAIATWLFGRLLMQLQPQIDERYTLLYIGIPWAVTSWMLAAICWYQGHRMLAVAGAVFWSGCALLAAWITLGFWNG